jgi:hypothetical protein
MPSDLIVVCSTCHPKLDREREVTALERARFMGWISKVYEDRDYDEQEAYERYEGWLLKKGEYL